MDTPMLSLPVAEQPSGELARLLLSLVVPRPIAWVASVDAAGQPNLAPFSFFNAISSRPPVLMVAVSDRPSGPKDTLANARATGQLVIHLVDEAMAAAMNETSTEWPAAIDEFAAVGLASLPASAVRPPRLAAAPVAFETVVTQLVPIAESSYTLILSRVVHLHLRADLVRPNGLADAERLRPVARLGGDEYTTLGRVFSLVRPAPPA